MSKLEELFEKKLADHAMVPSPAAWEKIEAQLSKKNKTTIWVRWAAIFLLCGLLSGVLILNKEKASQLTQKTQPKIEVAPKQDAMPLIAELKNESHQVSKQKVKKPQRNNFQVQPTSVVNQASLNQKEITEAALLVTEVQDAVVSEKAGKVEMPKPIVLTYTLDPVESREAESTGEKVAVAAEKKDKSLKRVMKIANEWKNSESPFNGIRNMKEELFALDLKNKTTNKKH